ncbi:MAG TPA: sulfatase-like hydrolase/transferase [Anaerolineales bacterium]|nr:sulfatase-like hydrolase/transferase [Anaerolineales bacterium]
MAILKKLILHPFLFALYPVLSLLSFNVSQTLVSDVFRSLVVVLLFAMALFGLSYLLTKNWHKAGLLTSGTLVLFFSYGHVISLLRGFSLGPILIGRTLVLLPLWLVLWTVFAWWVFRKRDAGSITPFFNIAGLLLLILPLFTLSTYYLQSELIRRSQKPQTPAALLQQFQGEPPDVYYIVLDMHARADVLEAIYGDDNRWFLDALREKGFYIADQSTSNYSSTLQSIASSLNMDYINDLQDRYGPDSNNREPLGLLLKENHVFKLFSENGYRLGAFQSDDFYTEFRHVDHYVKPSQDEVRQYLNFWTLSPFEGILMQSTLLRVLYDLDILSSEVLQQNTLEAPYDLHRLTILHTMEHLPDFSRERGAFFVFAHIVAPHPPYVFGRSGEEISHDIPYSLSGPGRQNGGPENIKLYVDQLHYLDTLILQAVDEILSQSENPPIIIIQSDHGPVSYVGQEEIAESNMKEQHAILNAYYFPGQNYDLLYPSVTPVNTFRIVFNTFLGGNYPLLPDKNYFIPHARPYDFIDVTERVRTDPLTP